MVMNFKNKLILENCFHVSYAAQKIGGLAFPQLKTGKDLTIGFIRNQGDDDEFYLEINTKDKNAKTGDIDTIRISVNDIDDIEHIEGTLQFYIHFRANQETLNQANYSLTGFFKR